MVSSRTLVKIVFGGAVAVACFVACSSSDDTSAGLFAPSVSGCTPTIDSIQKTVFVPRCATAGCHTGPTPQGDLDLGAAGVDARLAGATATQCAGKTLVVPGNPSGSYLIEKLGAKPSCGASMPSGGPALDPSDVACISNWIAGIKPGSIDGGAAGDGGGSDGAVGNACGPGLASCGSACVDKTTDPKNCGTCGNACAVVCSNGTCQTSCPNPTTNCSGACVDTSTSATNCGSCGNACGSGKVCVNKVCSCGTTSATLSAIQSQIFTPSCATQNCHVSTKVGPNKVIAPQAGLDLAAGNAFGSLVNVASSTCGGKMRVAPGDVASSYLMNKLTGVGMCSGSQMPKVGTSLPAAELDMVRSWICNGAAND